MAKYSLSREADADLQSIYEFGAVNFGIDQADTYFDGLVDQLGKIAKHPERYPRVDEIRAGYRRAIFDSHAIYFKASDDGVEVIRILGQQDLEEAL